MRRASSTYRALSPGGNGVALGRLVPGLPRGDKISNRLDEAIRHGAGINLKTAFSDGLFNLREFRRISRDICRAAPHVLQSCANIYAVADGGGRRFILRFYAVRTRLHITASCERSWVIQIINFHNLLLLLRHKYN